MHITLIDRGQVKRENKALLQTAQVSPKKMTFFFLAISTLLSISASALPSIGLFDFMVGISPDVLEPILITGTFVSILVTLMLQVLTVGYVLYCMDILDGHQVSFGALFNGFSFAGKIVHLMILQFFFTWMWSMLFVFPGIIAAYRYRFAFINLCRNPELTPNQALDLSKAHTKGYKLQLFMLDLSFLPWTILAQLPSITFYGTAFELSLFSAIPLPSVLVQTIIMGLWATVVSCFYLPLYQTSEISYFQIASAGKIDDNYDNCL